MFYRALVVDNKSPKNDGAVKIRVHGIHEGVQVDHLPYAPLADATFSSAGVGSPVIPQVGSIVWVFFEGDDFRFPVILAGSPAIVNNNPDIPVSSYEEDSTVSGTISPKRKTGVSTASGGSWDEPEYNPTPDYPNNHVIKTQHHLIEIDDTDGNARIHIFHKSGTRTEVLDNGDMVEHTNKKTEVNEGDYNHLVDGKLLLTITADGEILINGNLVLKVDGNLTSTVAGDVSVEAAKVGVNTSGDVSVSAGGSVSVTGGSNVTVSAPSISLN